MNSTPESGPVIVLGSAGRRLYLIEWFKAAFEQLGVDGRVIVAENDQTSAAFNAGDGSWCLPKYDEPEYESELLRLADELKPLAYISLNDYELQKLSHGLDENLRARNVLVPGVNHGWMSVAADKLRMYERLRLLGIPTPRTCLANDISNLESLRDQSKSLVVKHRFGSASSGLYLVEGQDVLDAIQASASDAPLFGQADPLAAVVVQNRVYGTEYGVDVVAPLTRPGAFKGILARRKVRMRAGETDKAITVRPDIFKSSGAKLADDAGLRGLMDMDVMVDKDGSMSVIDIDPRFGGGYPFVHLAGANVPLAYLTEALGRSESSDLLAYREGVISAKFEGVRVTNRGDAA